MFFITWILSELNHIYTNELDRKRPSRNFIIWTFYGLNKSRSFKGLSWNIRKLKWKRFRSSNYHHLSNCCTLELNAWFQLINCNILRVLKLSFVEDLLIKLSSHHRIKVNRFFVKVHIFWIMYIPVSVKSAGNISIQIYFDIESMQCQRNKLIFCCWNLTRRNVYHSPWMQMRWFVYTKYQSDN